MEISPAGEWRVPGSEGRWYSVVEDPAEPLTGAQLALKPKPEPIQVNGGATGASFGHPAFGAVSFAGHCLRWAPGSNRVCMLSDSCSSRAHGLCQHRGCTDTRADDGRVLHKTQNTQELAWGAIGWAPPGPQAGTPACTRRLNRLYRARGGAGLDSDSDEELSEGEELRRAVASAGASSRAKAPPNQAQHEVIVLDSDSDDDAPIAVSPAPPLPQVETLKPKNFQGTVFFRESAGRRRIQSVGPRMGLKCGQAQQGKGGCEGPGCTAMFPQQPSSRSVSRRREQCAGPGPVERRLKLVFLISHAKSFNHLLDAVQAAGPSMAQQLAALRQRLGAERSASSSSGPARPPQPPPGAPPDPPRAGGHPAAHNPAASQVPEP